MEIKYDFDEDGQLIIDGTTIPHDQFAEMLVKYQDGVCKVPDCGNWIGEGEIICDDCFAQAESYRDFGPPVMIKTTCKIPGCENDTTCQPGGVCDACLDHANKFIKGTQDGRQN